MLSIRAMRPILSVYIAQPKADRSEGSLREYTGKFELLYKTIFFGQFSDFSLYGSWEGVDMCKILPQGVGTISTPGKLNSEKFKI